MTLSKHLAFSEFVSQNFEQILMISMLDFRFRPASLRGCIAPCKILFVA
jgi:hypothetical protein